MINFDKVISEGRKNIHQSSALLAKFSDKGIQNVYTPIDKIEKATGFSFSDYIKNENLVLFNFEFVHYIIKHDRNVYITFIADSLYDKKECERICKENNFKNINIIEVFDFNVDKMMEELKKINKKFDVVFSNPPYNSGLDLIILKNLFSFSKNIIFIHPSSYLLDNKFCDKTFNVIRSSNHLEKVIMFWGNKIFSIGLFVPECISIWNVNKITSECKVDDNAFMKIQYTCEINDISIHGKFLNEVKKLNEKIQEHIKKFGTFHDHKIMKDYSNQSNWNIKFAAVRGHSPSQLDKENEKLKTLKFGFMPDFFSLISNNRSLHYVNKDFKYQSNKPYQEWLLWTFESEKEMENFYSFCKSKFIRFILSFIKINGNLARGEMKFLPWFDFTQEWNDKKLCEEFKFSKELWDYIDNFIPDYYDDYKSGF